MQTTQQEPLVPQNRKSDRLHLSDVYDLIELFVLAVGIIMLIFTLLCRISFVQGSSMENTLLENDVLLVSDLFYQPENGDIVVIQVPNQSYSDPYAGKAVVKRIIAMEGQTVEITRDGVYVDGVLLPEEDGSLGYTVNFEDPRYDSIEGYQYEYTPMGPITVGEGQIFVLGDHRSVSLDSRHPGVGQIDARCIIGKVYFRILPFSGFGSVK